MQGAGSDPRMQLFLAALTPRLKMKGAVRTPGRLKKHDRLSVLLKVTLQDLKAFLFILVGLLVI